MKQHLKVLLLSTLASVPVVSVIACSTSATNQVSDQDILNSAEGQMRDYTFEMTKLGLSEIPGEGTSYSELSEKARDLITEHYCELVRPGLSWVYPMVSVDITEAESGNFLSKYGENVESRINLIANLKYKDLKTSEVPIVVKISNNKSSPEAKVDAIRDYLKGYLNNEQPTFEFKTLLKDNLKSDDDEASYAYGSITSSLRTALFTAPKNEIPVIDVEGIGIEVLPVPPSASQTIFSLNSDAVDSDAKTFNGTLQNLTLRISDSGSFRSDLTTPSLKVIQNFSDANNQIAGILNQSPDALQFKNSELVGNKLPDSGDSLEKYDPNKVLTGKVIDEIFAFIDEVYPSTKITGVGWDKTKITIPNPSQSEFVLESEENPEDKVHYGYFIVSIDFTCKIGDSEITAKINDLQINLRLVDSSPTPASDQSW